MTSTFGSSFGFIVLPLAAAMLARLWFQTANDPNILRVSGPGLQRANLLVARAWLLVTMLSTVNSAWFIGTTIWPDAFWFLKPIPVAFGISFGVFIMVVPMLLALVLVFLSIRNGTYRPRRR